MALAAVFSRVGVSLLLLFNFLRCARHSLVLIPLGAIAATRQSEELIGVEYL